MVAFSSAKEGIYTLVICRRAGRDEDLTAGVIAKLTEQKDLEGATCGQYQFEWS
jgi:hypothetical protein